MDPLNQLLAVDQRETLQFFFAGLRDVTANANIDSPTLLYNASVLAHFASTSTWSPDSMPPLKGLGDVFDRFVTDTSLRRDSELMEWAAAQCLLFTGFFQDQMQRRHNVEWFSYLGADFYDYAAEAARQSNRKRILSNMSTDFWFWRRQYTKLARELRDAPYLICG